MSSTALNWQAAEEVANKLTASWNQPGEPGGAVILFDMDQLRVETAGGLANLANGEIFTPDSIVRYASVTKHIFAALALNDTDGVVSLNETLGSYLPVLQGDIANVTVGQALDMTGGLPDVRETLSLLGISVYQVSEAPEILEFLGQLKELNYPAGTEISYSNTGYRLVEAALNTKGIYFDDLVQKNLCKPLGIQMKAPETWFDIVDGLVPGYWKSPQGWKLATAGLHLSASGSLTGSARSLSRWLQHLLNSPDIFESLSAVRYLNNGEATHYGLGITRNTIGKQLVIGHGGSHSGYKTYFLLEPKNKVGVVLVSNREDSDTYGGALNIMAALLNENLPDKAAIIPNGTYITEASAGKPLWIEVNGSSVNYLGSGNTVYHSDRGTVVSMSAHLPIDLKWTGSAVEGQIGHVARRFVEIEPDENDFALIQGLWRQSDYYSEFEIKGKTLRIGVGPTAIIGKLTSFGQGRMLLEWFDGPWQQRFCLHFQGDNVDMIANRSRVLRFNHKR